MPKPEEEGSERRSIFSGAYHHISEIETKGGGFDNEEWMEETFALMRRKLKGEIPVSESKSGGVYNLAALLISVLLSKREKI